MATNFPGKSQMNDNNVNANFRFHLSSLDSSQAAAQSWNFKEFPEHFTAAFHQQHSANT